MVKNPAPASAPVGFAIKIRQNPAPAGFGKIKSGTTLVGTILHYCELYLWVATPSQ